MPQPVDLDPSDFFLKKGPVGVLLIHGFTGAPPEMRLIGEYLYDSGFTVSCPLLPGHGTRAVDMNKYTWMDWTARVEKALDQLISQCERLFIGGLSLGSLIALYLAAHRTDLSGLILYSPAIQLTSKLIYFSPIFKHVISTFKKDRPRDDDPTAIRKNWSYDENPIAAAHELLKFIKTVKTLLPKMSYPVLMIQSTQDPTVRQSSSRFIFDRIKSVDKEIFMLHQSGHCLTIDEEWETVAEKTHQFISEQLESITGAVDERSSVS